MKNIACLVTLVLSISFQLQSQTIKKVIFDQTDSVHNYYLTVEPESHKIQGVLLLFPGFRESAESIFPETKLHNVAYVHDVLTVAIGNGDKLFPDEHVLKRLDAALRHLITRYNLDPAKFVIGGFSAGGLIALRYTEMCKENPSRFPINPEGVFAIDSPIDLAGVYQYFEREIEKNYSQAGVSEAVFAKALLEKELGDYKTSLANYVSNSPFYRDGKNGNERFLKNTAVRVYHDIDIEWKLKNRRRSFFDSNEAYTSEMINRLLLMGNERAEFKIGRTGYRSSGMRHPHSWSIVDEIDLIQWVKKTLQFFPDFAPQPYCFATPPDMYVEKEKFPLSFAPDIEHEGIADIRFFPGFYDALSIQKWSYCYVWHLTDGKLLNEAVLKDDLTRYYKGLSGLATTSASVKKIKTESGFESSYQAVVNTADSRTNSPLTLNLRISVKSCSTSSSTLAFFEISPQPFSSTVWQDLKKIKETIACEEIK